LSGSRGEGLQNRMLYEAVEEITTGEWGKVESLLIVAWALEAQLKETVPPDREP
jgi:hypothetical protein